MRAGDREEGTKVESGERTQECADSEMEGDKNRSFTKKREKREAETTESAAVIKV